jgi:parvulin-like peptidyl-prolyl isomerase
MKRLIPLLFVVCSVSAQSPAPSSAPAGPAVPDDQVVVTIEGRAWKKSEMEAMIRSLGPTQIKNYYADKKAFLEQLGLFVKLAEMAEKDGLAEQDIHKYRMLFSRWQYLSTAELNAQRIRDKASDEDYRKYYEDHKQDFARAKSRVIYLTFDNSGTPGAGGKKARTEEESKALADQIVKQIRNGADFLKLVSEYSDDADSKSNGGEYPEIKPNDNSVPANVKAALFSLKEGEITEPIRQPNGYYIFRLDKMAIPPYDHVSAEVFESLRDLRFQQWLESLRKSVSVQFHSEDYLKEPAQR